MKTAPRKILFVCMGNICRSPTAAGVFTKAAKTLSDELDIEVDSAGTHAYHVGDPPDPRAQRAAEKRGIDLSAMRARRVAPEDFAAYDLVLAMDRNNLAVLEELCPPDYRYRLRLLLAYAPQLGLSDVPDPYYGGVNGFEYVLDLVEEAVDGLLQELRKSRRAAVS